MLVLQGNMYHACAVNHIQDHSVRLQFIRLGLSCDKGDFIQWIYWALNPCPVLSCVVAILIHNRTPSISIEILQLIILPHANWSI